MSNGKTGILLARGKFADDMMEPELERHGAQKFTYKGLTMLGTETGAVTLINSTTAALGDAPRCTFIDQRGTSLDASGAIAALNQIPGNAQFWAAYGVDRQLPFDENSNLGNLNRLLASVSNRHSPDFDLSLTASMALPMSPAPAYDDGAGGNGRARSKPNRHQPPERSQNQPDLAQVYDAVHVDTGQRRECACTSTFHSRWSTEPARCGWGAGKRVSRE